jgi:hypothetical protein
MPDELNLNSEVVPAVADLTAVAGNGIQEPPIDQAELDRLEAKRAASRERTRKHRAAKKEQAAGDHYNESRGLPVSDDRKRQLAHWRAIGQVNDGLSDEMDLARAEMRKQPPTHLDKYLSGLMVRLNDQLETNLKEQKLGMPADVVWLCDIKRWYWGSYRTYLLNKHNPDWRAQLAEALPQANDGNSWTAERLKRAVTGMSEPDNWPPETLTAPLPELRMPDAEKAMLEVRWIIKQAKQWMERQEQQFKAMRNSG